MFSCHWYSNQPHHPSHYLLGLPHKGWGKNVAHPLPQGWEEIMRKGKTCWYKPSSGHTSSTHNPWPCQTVPSPSFWSHLAALKGLCSERDMGQSGFWDKRGEEEHKSTTVAEKSSAADITAAATRSAAALIAAAVTDTTTAGRIPAAAPATTAVAAATSEDTV